MDVLPSAEVPMGRWMSQVVVLFISRDEVIMAV